MLFAIVLHSVRIRDVARWAWVVVLGVSVGMASPALAQQDPAERAGELFRESADHYKAGRFEKAIALLTEAYTLTSEPVLLYNLARAYEGHGELDKAITAYRRYLDQASDVKDRGAIERRVATLEKQLAEKKALEKEAEDAKRRAAAAEREQPSPSPVPWAIAGIGASGIVVGAVLGALANGRESDATAAPGQVDADALAKEGETFATAANVSFAVGGALVLGGVAWGVADIVLLPGPATSAAMVIAPNHVALRVLFQ